jgi:chromosome condensin MukBEF ATPase and DNA-binding subunit MukB
MVIEASTLQLSREIASLAENARQIGLDAQANSSRSLVLDDAYNQKSKLIGLGRQLEAISKKLEEQSNQEDTQESLRRESPTPRATGMRQGAWFQKQRD